MYNHIQVFIQAIPQRKEYIEGYMVPLLKKEGLIHINIIYDTDMKGPMFNFKQILYTALNFDISHFLVLQDDVIFAEDFGKHVSDLCLLEIGAISLFCPPRKQYLVERDNGTRIYTEKNFLWIPAMLYTKSYMTMLYHDSIKTEENKHDDVFVGGFAKRTKNYVRVTIPSLVQHNLQIKSSLGTAPKIGSITRESQIFYSVKSPYFI